MNGSLPQLSIIVPAYNEERRLPPTLGHIREYLRMKRLEAEVIVVDDGSQDGTARLIAEWQSQFPELRLVSNGRNRGKGYSVRRGMREARGQVVLFTDADFSVPIAEIEKLLAALNDADIAIGSRAMDRGLMDVQPPFLRLLAGAVFNRFVQLFVGVSYRDTQCGFKAFRRDRTQILFTQQRIDSFAFDPEILFLAGRYHLRTVEVPVRSSHDSASKVRLVRDSCRMVLDLMMIRWNWIAGRYMRPQVQATAAAAFRPSETVANRLPFRPGAA